MLKAMESYSAGEEAGHESFLETYYQVVLQMLSVGKLLHIETHSLLEMLITRKNKAIDAYKRELLGVDVYVQFFNNMAQLYKKNGDNVNLDGAMHTYFLLNYMDVIQIVTISMYPSL